MSGFFTRLAQRTLSTAQVIRPFIAPRFAQDFTMTEESRSAEEVGAQHESLVRTAENDKPTFVAENAQAKHTSNLHIQAQVEARPVHSVDPSLEFQSRLKQQQEQDNLLVKPATVVTKRQKGPVTPAEQPNSAIEAPPNIPIKTKVQILPDNHKNDPGQIANNELLDTPLVPMPFDQSRDVEHSSGHFEDYSSVNGRLIPRIELLENSNQRKAHDPDQSQAVNITIGRIEVRAVHPAPAPIKSNRTKINPALSLDDYLQQRRKGER